MNDRQERINEYVNGELTAEQREQFLREAATDAALRDELAVQQKMHTLLSNLKGVAMPSELEENIRKSAATAAPRPVGIVRHSRLLALAACLLLSLALLLLAQGVKDSDKHSPPAGLCIDESGQAQYPATPVREAVELLDVERECAITMCSDMKVRAVGGGGAAGGKFGGRIAGDADWGGGGFDDAHTGADNTEQYHGLPQNPFKLPSKDRLSTFSTDVDTASYTNARRFLAGQQLPPPDSVRVEEFINYFDYDYPQPKGDHPFNVVTEVAACPWNAKHRLLHIGLQGKSYDQSELPPRNLVFLIDVSGSMADANKLPLVKKSLAMLVENLDARDRIAMVVYAGAAGLVLDSTPCTERAKVLAALEELQAGGSTAGGAGIELAYKVAQENFIKDGVNRVMLCTDGDFNVGTSHRDGLVGLIEEKRQTGVYLTILGFGMGNYQDYNLESIADAGNGNYAYIDNESAAKKVLVTQAAATLVTIAKDVKIQVDFNPAEVAAFRLIGYENRVMANEDFRDDIKDAGEIGAGHTVTALYEIIPAGLGLPIPGMDQSEWPKDMTPGETEEIAGVSLRYKLPDSNEATEFKKAAFDEAMGFANASKNFRFAAAAAGFGLLLRGSDYAGDADFDDVIGWAESALGNDANGYRAEFVTLVREAKRLRAADGENKQAPAEEGAEE